MMSAKCQKRTSRECSCAFNNQDGPDGPTCVLSAANDATASRAYLHDTSQKGAEAPKEGGLLRFGRRSCHRFREGYSCGHQKGCP